MWKYVRRLFKFCRAVGAKNSGAWRAQNSRIVYFIMRKYVPAAIQVFRAAGAKNSAGFDAHIEQPHKVLCNAEVCEAWRAQNGRTAYCASCAHSAPVGAPRAGRCEKVPDAASKVPYRKDPDRATRSEKSAARSARPFATGRAGNGESCGCLLFFWPTKAATVPSGARKSGTARWRSTGRTAAFPYASRRAAPSSAFKSFSSGAPLYLKAFLDGKATKHTVATGDEKLLFESLDDGEHTLTLLRVSESIDSLRIESVTLLGGNAAFLDPPAEKERRIEFFGDSITCGYGVLAEPWTVTGYTAFSRPAARWPTRI